MAADLLGQASGWVGEERVQRRQPLVLPLVESGSLHPTYHSMRSLTFSFSLFHAQQGAYIRGPGARRRVSGCDMWRQLHAAQRCRHARTASW